MVDIHHIDGHNSAAADCCRLIEQRCQQLTVTGRLAPANAAANAPAKGVERQLREPGTFYEYNDVRVNRLSLAAMRVLRRPLPDVLRERIMDPIGQRGLPSRAVPAQLQGVRELLPRS